MAWILSVGEGWYHVDMSIVPVAFASAPSISHCPECGYCLTGLPSRHRCPECGFEYDEFTRVWKPRWPRMVYLVILLPVILQFPNLVRPSFWTTIPYGLAGPMALLLAVVSALLLWRLWRASEANARGRFVALTPAGLRIRTTIETRMVPWSSLVRVRHRRFWSKITIEVTDPELQAKLKPLSMFSFNGDSLFDIIARADRDHFVAVLNQAIERHRGPVDSAEADH